MHATGASGLHLEYRLDSGVAVVKVTGEVDVSTSGACETACCGSSPMRVRAAWS
jgi:Fe-S cluster biogenesis protein NfuA